jgi:hypothetical protein
VAKYQKGVKVIPILIIVVTLMVGSYFVYRYYSSSFQSSVTSSQTSPENYEPIETWETYHNKELGIFIKYPTDLRVIKEEERQVHQPVDYVGYSILIADEDEPLKTTKSIIIQVENTLSYEVPWSNGNIIILNKDNFEAFHLPGPENVEKIDISGRYSLLTQHTTNGLNTIVSILDDDRVLKIKIDSEDESLTTLHNQILSTLKLTD